MLNRSRITCRVSPWLWLDDVRFAELLDDLTARRDGFDDLALFSSFVHSPVSLDTMRERAPVLARRFEAIRERGFGAGVNLLCTVGFFPENLGDVPPGLPLFTDAAGWENPGSLCHAGEEYREEYLKPLLELLAGAGPDFLWLDDDQHGHCFCDRCMAQFNAWNHSALTRDELRTRFNAGTPAEQIDWRWKFLRASGRSLTGHYRFIERTVHRAAPAVELGGMDILGNWWDDNDFPAWYAALSGPEKRPVRWRPGGGTYTDRVMDEFALRKGMLFGLDAAWMPPALTDRRSEVENFTYQRLKKSRHATALEACIYNACGMTGTAWNLFEASDDLAVYRPLLDSLTGLRPFLDEQVRAFQLTPPRGVWNGWTPKIACTMGFGGEWERHDRSLLDNPHGGELFTAGLGAAFDLEHAEVTILSGDTARTLDDAAVRRILEGGLYCDVPSLQILSGRGFGDLLGFRAVENIAVDARERLTGHPLNGAGAGHVRDCRQSFSRGPGWNLEALDGGGETLAELIDYRGRVVAPCAMGLYRNRAGGRVAVAGYYPLSEISFAYKIAQLKQVFDFLSGDGLTGLVTSYHRIFALYRPDSVFLVNASQDAAEDAELRLKTPAGRISMLDMYGRSESVAGAPAGDGMTAFRLPPLLPWHAFLIRYE